MVGALILGLIAGALARVLVPGENNIEGCLPTLALGLAGSLLGWFVFTQLFGIGDNDIFDLGGIIGAIVGSVVLLLIWGAVTGRKASSGRR